MGRELVIQLAARGCGVAACDLDGPGIKETLARAKSVAQKDVILSSHVCDVADRVSVDGLPDAVATAHLADHLDFLFNNAGVHGEESFVNGDRERWERVFSVCWNAVYLPSRAFLPMLMAGRAGWLVNTSSLNGFFARHGDGAPCTAYSAAKFAVRGLTEALIEDFRTYAPSVRVATVLPGTVVTGLSSNSDRILGRRAEPDSAGGVGIRDHLKLLGVPTTDLAEGDLSKITSLLRDIFMMPAAQAVRQILAGVQEGRWRILVGEDAVEVDAQVRARPEEAYEPGGVNQVNVDLLRALVSLVVRADPERIRGLEGVFQVVIGRYDLVCRVSPDGIEIDRHGGDDGVSAIVEAEPDAFRRVLSGEEPIDQAMLDGRLRIAGDRHRFDALVKALRPEPIAT
ncbi:NAD(P)-dependent dehydrogenase (short-subunit alcohol dehydrogenase family) [Kribbella aluminosa]|uniref:NAD(P)-dependent dehydrogenase (Short-subunit alcohol dehydrogenase family) n=2 Tax=Kribbella aluminosa TaxID=416017 RepID=A0ABS4UIF1_9ACTN|nr:NAD(P)-dependent dehydrogenase (short-subunit alcohol dehydrogenase family) [Kribbella aluminosa]